MSPRVGLDLTSIVKTAAQMVDEEGVEAVTLASIARKLNVRPPSLFNHIKGLPNLKRELSLYGLELLYEQMRVAANGKRKDEAIMAIANSYLKFSREHPGLYDLTLRAPEKDDVEMKTVSNHMIKLLSEILADYELSEHGIIHAIRGLRSILHGYATLEQKGAFGLMIEVEESFRLLMDGYISFLSQMKG